MRHLLSGDDVIGRNGPGHAYSPVNIVLVYLGYSVDKCLTDRSTIIMHWQSGWRLTQAEAITVPSMAPGSTWTFNELLPVIVWNGLGHWVQKSAMFVVGVSWAYYITLTLGWHHRIQIMPTTGVAHKDSSCFFQSIGPALMTADPRALRTKYVHT